MRLLVINTSGAPETERLRRRHPGKVFQRPVINTLTLAPAGRRVLPVEMLTADVVDRLEYLVSIGNIKVAELGSRKDVDFAELRQRLHLAAKKDIESPTPVPLASPVLQESHEESAISPAEVGSDVEQCSYCHEDFPVPVALHHAEEECLPSSLPPLEGTTDGTLEEAMARVGSARSADLEELLAAIETAPSEVAAVPEPVPGPGELFVLPSDIGELVRGSKNKELVAALAAFGKAGSGKSKLVLVQEVLSALSGDPDPLLANRVVDLLRSKE